MMIITVEECKKIAHDACMMGYNMGTSMVLRMVKDLIDPDIYENMKSIIEEGEQFKDGKKVLDLLDNIQKKDPQ